MKTASRIFLAGAMAGIVSLQALAADKDGNFALRGFGAQTCGRALEALGQNQRASAPAMAWLLGYSTAFNRMQSGTFDISPVVNAAPLLNMIVGVCGNNRDKRVETVAFEILRTLASARVTASGPIVETKSGDIAAPVRRETLVQMQVRLKESGHLAGEPDGVFGKQTEAALKTFQSEQKLPVTGIADAATVIRLLVELPAKGG